MIQLNRTDIKTSTKRNSGGIALYIQTDSLHILHIIRKAIWIKINGHLINLSNVYLCLCYIFPASSSREAFVETDVLERISNYVTKIANDTNDCYYLLICGDLNSRVGNEKDYVIFDNTANIDILPIDYKTYEIIPRFSQDNTINTNGRKLLNFCKFNSLRIANGRLGLDKGVGKYTCVGSTSRSVIDYVIVNPSLFDVICDFHVGDPNILSDHCGIEFSMTCKPIHDPVNTRENIAFQKVDKKYIWRSEHTDQYVFNLLAEENGSRELCINLTHSTTAQHIDDNINTFSCLILV